jgi:hypothetical protein
MLFDSVSGHHIFNNWREPQFPVCSISVPIHVFRLDGICLQTGWSGGDVGTVVIQPRTSSEGELPQTIAYDSVREEPAASLFAVPPLKAAGCGTITRAF